MVLNNLKQTIPNLDFQVQAMHNKSTHMYRKLYDYFTLLESQPSSDASLK